ncbi:hypothetical protein [Epilithonimonas sp.]|uniref:hypothetical protein n=1 Tax=Epilithonimonas sp. TaxID=2894511 RepID=UPI0035AED8AA
MMVYLFDDKKERQEDFSWNDERFLHFQDIIIPIYSYNDEEVEKLNVFSEGNIILFHESFFDGADAEQQKHKITDKYLTDYASQNDKSSVVFFSGSKSNRKIIDNLGFLPVSELYKNLEIFLIKLLETDFNLKYLFFGNNFEVEEQLIKKLEHFNNIYGEPINDSENSNIVFQSLERAIPNPLKNALHETMFEDDINDTYLNKLVLELLGSNDYDNIFIPLCFGSTLSDYNGLRLATHIRCTNTPNQLKNIFIYSIVGYYHLINNEYFDILKTKNIYLINYTKHSFEDAILMGKSRLKLEQLPKEIRKIKLLPPKNYQDSHGINNEWAIYRWAISMKISSSDIKKILNIIDNNLYFKYLKTVFPISEIETLNERDLGVNFVDIKKILYIDDEAEKGWNLIFKKFFTGNAISFQYLDNEFNSKTKSEIIDLSYNKIINDNIDLIILDFRLHPEDFSELDIYEITGVKLLKKVKEYNPGIQIIIFSATNKIWSYKALQKEGADGFIMKESPRNSIQTNYTANVIKDFIDNIKTSEKMIFLKDVNEYINNIMINFNILFSGQNDLLSEIQSFLAISFKLLQNYRNEDKYLNYAYIQIFLVIELFISQKDIFEDDETASVVVDGERIIVEQKTGDDYFRSIKFTSGKYKIEQVKIGNKSRLDTNFKVSALLIYRFGNQNSSVMKWTSLYMARNTRAAHYNTENKELNITMQEVFDLLNFIEYLSKKNNINKANIEKGLKKKSNEDLLQGLKDRFNSPYKR